MRLIGVKPRGKVVFEIEGNRVRVHSPKWTIETLAGSIPPLDEPRDIDEQIRRAKEERAKGAREKLRR